MSTVHAVVVAFNRRELLAAALAAIDSQSEPVDRIHVVDNASTDGTVEMVRQRFPDVSLHALPVNTGGAGGFAAGTAYALAGSADLVWLMDDDTIPEPEALAELLRAYDGYSGGKPSLIASKVVWTDGRDHPMNTPRRRPGASARECRAADEVGCVPVRSASFVSVLVDAAAVRKVGLPEAEFFLWNDDFEFTTRLLRQGIGLYCPSSRVEHRTRVFGSTSADPGERFYYEVRNKLWTFLRSDGLSVPEKLLYGGSTIRRWARTFAGSKDRATLRDGLRRGAIDGLRRGPRDPMEVLVDAGVDVPDPNGRSGHHR